MFCVDGYFGEILGRLLEWWVWNLGAFAFKIGSSVVGKGKKNIIIFRFFIFV